MRDMGDHYEYICAYVNDLLSASKNPKAIVDELSKEYTLKGVGPPEYYLGANIERNEDPEKVLTMGSGTYIDKCLVIFEQLFGAPPPNTRSLHHWIQRITLRWTPLLSWTRQVYTCIGNFL